MIPGKTLTGIWRDACERLADGLNEGRSGPWHEWVEHLFGSRRQVSLACSRSRVGTLGIDSDRKHVLAGFTKPKI